MNARDILLAAGGCDKRIDHIAVAHAGPPYLSLFMREGSSLIPLANLSSGPNATVESVAVSADGRWLAVAYGNVVAIHRVDGPDTAFFGSISFGASLPVEVSLSPDGVYLAVGVDDGLKIFKNTGASYSELSEAGMAGWLPAGNGAFSPVGDYLIADYYNDTSGDGLILHRNGDTFTSITHGGGYLRGPVAWTSDDVYLACSGDEREGLEMYKRTGATFAHLTTTVTMVLRSLSFSGDGVYLAAATTWSGYGGNPPPDELLVYKRSGDTCAQVWSATMGDGFRNDGFSVSLNRDGTYLYVAAGNGLKVYERLVGTDTFSLVTSRALPGIATCIDIWPKLL